MDNLAKMSRVQKMTFSAMVMAMYIVILYFTQSFSFGAYQIRIATALYALAYLFPFLIEYALRRIRHCGHGGRLHRGNSCRCLYCTDPQEKLEPGSDRSSDHIGTWSGSSYLSVLFPFHALSADGGKSLYRTDDPFHCGSDPGESPGKGNLSGKNSRNNRETKHRALIIRPGSILRPEKL